MTASNHTPEAIDAYPDTLLDEFGWRSVGWLRTAFDRGVASVRAQQYAVTREALAKSLHENFNAARGRNGVDPLDLADALLAPDGPLLDAADVWDEGVASTMWAIPNSNRSGIVSRNPYRKASA